MVGRNCKVNTDVDVAEMGTYYMFGKSTVTYLKLWIPGTIIWKLI